MPPWGWLLLYFAAHVLGRVLVSPALELDEAEQAVWTQHLQWGYGAQPPLYTWLQWAVFQVLGASVFTLSLLKNALLALAYVCVYLAGRTLMPASLAALGAATMLLLPQIGWEASRDLTHSVLLTTVSAATLAVVLALLRRPRPALYLLTGFVAGLGLLSKYSYAGFLAVLLLALLAGRDTRAVLLSRWTLAAIALAALMVLPHGLWVLQHWSLAVESTAGKLTGKIPVSFAHGLWLGLSSMVLAVLAFSGLWALTMGLLFGRTAVQAWSRWWRPAAAPPGGGLHLQALWRRYFVALGLLFLAMMVFGEVTRFKDRWMMPFLFLLPVAFFSCAPELAQHARLPRLRRVLLSVAVLVLVLLTARVPYNAMRDKPDELNQPVRELAQALRARGYAGKGIILSNDRTLAGALRLQFPRAHIEVDGGEGDSSLPTERPLLWVEPLTAELPTLPQDLVLPYHFSSSGDAPARYRYTLLP
ncbi:4-amino-4-deoxy-L-arabinose transferase-like glycosyltransferase [Pseudorhodoferax soli]|uniref:4-amino-4-deoxy-L-arabinose transferase-like glycosyltransferase n=2 Tax=Pseudorhodoferax soli TaxID=545864 RepID=A0A368XCP0_9BURK|nr:4-amino-4-deoxy-L-arabinose transferase-like glycosyltransferase [Pseudorhodoferax soli]